MSERPTWTQRHALPFSKGPDALHGSRTPSTTDSLQMWPTDLGLTNYQTHKPLILSRHRSFLFLGTKWTRTQSIGTNALFHMRNAFTCYYPNLKFKFQIQKKMQQKYECRQHGDRFSHIVLAVCGRNGIILADTDVDFPLT